MYVTFVFYNLTKFVIFNTQKKCTKKMVGVFTMYIYKICHVPVVHLLPEPGRKIKIHFRLPCIFHILQKADFLGSRTVPFRNERVRLKQSVKRKIWSYSRLHESVLRVMSVRSCFLLSPCSLTNRSSVSNSPWVFFHERVLLTGSKLSNGPFTFHIKKNR
jgi:hypothetical protein